ncbi:MAG: histidinol-phosphate aminotransferase family protein [Synergistales bacterium]|nr:histidinol-phosphate aminotransferase family protein [Synergistales bacterium]
MNWNEDGTTAWLDKNESPYSLPPAPREELRELLCSLDFNRYPDPDCRAVKRMLSERTGVPEQCIFVGNGSDEILQYLFLSYLNRGSRRLVRLYPSFTEYQRLARVFSADERKVPLTLEADRFHVDYAALLDVIAGNSPDLVLIDNPNNPTGLSIDCGQLEELADLSPCPVVVDEAYAEFASSSMLDRFSLQQKNMLILRTLSKAWGMAGLRLGYAVGPPDLIADLEAVRSPYNVGGLTQSVAGIALSYQEWMESRVYSVRYLRKQFIDTVNRISGFRAFPSEANFTLVRSSVPEQVLDEACSSASVALRRVDDLPWEGTWRRVAVGREEEMRRVLDVFQGLSEQSERRQTQERLEISA